MFARHFSQHPLPRGPHHRLWGAEGAPQGQPEHDFRDERSQGRHQDQARRDHQVRQVHAGGQVNAGSHRRYAYSLSIYFAIILLSRLKVVFKSH